MAALTEEPLLNVREVAELLRVHPLTVRRYISEGALAAVQLPGGYHRVRRQDVEEMLRQGRTTA